jgi:hypothetical protein
MSHYYSYTTLFTRIERNLAIFQTSYTPRCRQRTGTSSDGGSVSWSNRHILKYDIKTGMNLGASNGRGGSLGATRGPSEICEYNIRHLH